MIKRSSAIPELAFVLFTSILSFCLLSIFSSNNYHSDHAIHVLMSYYLDLPADLYYWGQDRLGSLLPIISHIFVKLGTDPFITTAVVNQVILTVACVSMIGLLKDIFSKIIFTIIWFFPPIWFNELLLPGHPDSLQIGIIAVIISLTNNLTEESDFKKFASRYLLILLLTSLSLWIAESSIVTLIFPAYLLYRSRTFQTKGRFFSLVFITSLFYAVSATAIMYAKEQAIQMEGYSKLNSIVQILDHVILIVSNIITASVSGMAELIFVLVFTVILVFVVLNNLSTRSSETFQFTITVSLLLLSISIISAWVFENGGAARYFTGSFYFALTAFLIHLNEKPVINAQYSKSLILILAAATLITEMQNAENDSPHATYKRLKTYTEGMRSLSVIGDYWHSYNIAAIDPSRIIATPHDKSHSRSELMKRKVLLADTIYAIKDYWLESFPDTLSQYGNRYKKHGSSFSFASYTACKYYKLEQ